MTDRVVVLRKLTLLREHVERMRSRRPAALDAFRDDTMLQDAVALNLVVALQEALDIALHIAADEGWGAPASYAEGFDTLAAHGLIEQGLARRLGGIATLRNRIAHGYATVDFARLWAEIPDGLDALDAFAGAVATYLGTGA